MTIRPTPTSYVMRCDEPGCDLYAHVDTPADIKRIVNDRPPRFRWERIVEGSGLDQIVTHRCPRCAAAERRNAA